MAILLSDAANSFSANYSSGGIVVFAQTNPADVRTTEKQQVENKLISSNRIFIEHLIRLLKTFRATKDRFRLHLVTYTQVIATVCGLVRLRIGTLVLQV